MTSLISYSVQALLLSALLIIFCLKRRSLDGYLLAVIVIWTVSVIGIYWHYRSDQILFYSNDQLSAWRFIYQYIPAEGIPLRFNELINWRYIVILPAYFLTKVGLDGVLALKFEQLVYLVLIYQTAKQFLRNLKISLKWWHVVLFCGPMSIFMSTLALRDVSLGYFALLFLIETRPQLKFLGFIGTLLLRPHLALALVFGWIIAYFLRNLKRENFVIGITFASLLAYVVGSYSYLIGVSLRNNSPLGSNNAIWSQLKISRLAANIFGVQFLTFNDAVVSASVNSLLISRIVFIDTFLAPILFIGCLYRFSNTWNRLNITIFISFVFFYGLVSQTSWNSSRQNIPFLISMGLLAVVGIESRRQTKNLDFVN